MSIFPNEKRNDKTLSRLGALVSRNAHIGYQMKIAHLSNASDGFLRSICVASSLFRYEPSE